MSHDGRKGQSETDSEEGFEMKVLGAWIARCTLGLILLTGSPVDPAAV